MASHGAFLCVGQTRGPHLQQGSAVGKPTPPPAARRVLRPRAAARPRGRARCCPAAEAGAGAGSARAIAAAAADEIGVVCISELRGPADHMEALMAANQLVTNEFYPRRPSGIADAVSRNSYRLRHAAQNLGLHLNEGARGRHATLLAVPARRGAQQRQGERADDGERQRRQGLGGSGGGGGGGDDAAAVGTAAARDAVGVCNVTLRFAGESIAEACGCQLGAPFAMVTNMTVLPEWRRRGVARQLMQSSLVTATCRLSKAPDFMALLCYKGYAPAYRLYESFGFEPTEWMDPEWKEDAERSRVGKPRRLLMVKPLRAGMVIPAAARREAGAAAFTAAAAAAALAAAAEAS